MIQYLHCKVKMPLLELPVTSMVVRLKNAVVLVSPGSGLSEEELRAAGPVTDIVVPNLLHAAGVPRAHRVFPQARVWGPPGARKAKPEMPWTDELTAWPYAEELAAIPVAGVPKLNEYVFFDRASGTLFAADLFFNLVRARGVGAWIILNLFGTYRRLGVSKFYLRYAEDRAAFAASVKPLLDLPIRTLAVAHGDPITEDPVPRMRAAFAERGL